MKWHVSGRDVHDERISDAQYEVFKWLEEWTGKGEKKIQGEDVGTPRLVIQA